MPTYDCIHRDCGSKQRLTKSYPEFDQDQTTWNGLVALCVTCQTFAVFDVLPGNMLDFILKGKGFYATDNRDEIEQYQIEHF